MKKSPKTFSVLTVSKRTGWEPLAWASMNRQTAHRDKWIVVHEEPVTFQALPRYTHLFPELVLAPEKTRPSNLNASLNAGLRRVKTDYVIFYQDFIELQPDCFEKLLNLVDNHTFVTTCTPNYDESNDSRYTACNCVRECAPREWEANVAIAPMSVIRELGGFDEEYDNGWAWDNVNLAHRAFLLGCRFLIDETNRPKLYPHEMSSHKTLTPNGDRHEQTMRAIMHGEKSLRLNYLTEDGRDERRDD